MALLEQRLRTLLHVVRRAEKEPGLKDALKLADAEGERRALVEVMNSSGKWRKAGPAHQDASLKIAWRSLGAGRKGTRLRASREAWRR